VTQEIPEIQETLVTQEIPETQEILEILVTQEILVTLVTLAEIPAMTEETAAFCRWSRSWSSRRS
ncbi:MAG: hypothetical protein FWG58_02360, partial [Methanomassiliicoccaceae archaeon]|nr:hypothetical protein [Methanomassiliicoccaceae archaeon]